MSIGVSMWVGLRHPERCHLCCCGDLSERHSLSRGALAISRTKTVKIGHQACKASFVVVINRRSRRSTSGGGGGGGGGRRRRTLIGKRKSGDAP